MIAINNLIMGFSQRTLFKDVTFSIFKGEKIGLTGPNGAGKTTLFSIILGDLEPLGGDLQIQKNINIGYLPQEAKFASQRTVMDEMTQGDLRMRKLIKEKKHLEDTHKAATERYGDVLHELEVLGIYELEHKAEKILSGLGFKEETFRKPIAQLSGGWQMRTWLAKLLTCPYDLLLLDEPTNYLDLEATLWLKSYLSNYSESFILISHDRVFLNDVTNYTIILDNSKIAKVKGNYADFERQREILNISLEKRKKVIDKKRQQLIRFTERFHAQPNRAAAVKNKRKMIERLEEIEIEQGRKNIGEFEFNDINSSGYVVADLKNVAKRYGDKVVYEDLNLEILRGQRICLVGPNGAGKSTLLKMLAGVIDKDNGEIKYGQNVELGYFSQTRLDVLNPNRSLFDEVCASVPGGSLPQQKVRTLLALFNFHGDDVFKTVNVLSGGEKSRLILAKLLINPPNFMLLDEPTTHLDLDGVKAITEAFQQYRGTLCFISHDLYFIKEIADYIVDVSGGKLKVYHGGLDYYLEKKNSQEQEDVKKIKMLKEEKKRLKEKKKKEGKENATINNLHKQHKKALNRLNQIKNEIKKIEQEQKELETETYVKSRMLSESFGRDQETIKECGRRLKEIQSLMREKESQINRLKEERDQINKI